MMMQYDNFSDNIYNVVIISENKKENRDQFTQFAQLAGQNFPRINVLFSDNYYEACESLSSNKFDLVIVDVDCVDGKNFLLKMDDKNLIGNLPVVLVGSDSSNDAKINAMECGFDDYICKPILANELFARTKNLLRKIKKATKSHNKQIITVGDIRMNSVIRTVTICNRGAKISTKEFNILKLFLENPDKVFSRQEILEKIWDNSKDLNVRIVDVHINRLRIALGNNKGSRSYIRTVRGYGYSLDVYDSESEDQKRDYYLDSMNMNNSNFVSFGENYNNYSNLNKFLHTNV